jgi:hypothetical protein
MLPLWQRRPHRCRKTVCAFGQDGAPRAEKPVGAHAPQVTIVAPNGGELISGRTVVSWTASDLDVDRLSYALLVSRDNGATWETIAIDLHDLTTTGTPVLAEYSHPFTKGDPRRHLVVEA